MRSLRFLFALLIGGVIPAVAQFSIVVQQNGQALNAASGATITLNTPAVGLTASAVVTLTYLGTGTAAFQTPPRVQGPPEFGVQGSAPTLNPFESTSFTVTYKSNSSPAEIAQLLYPFNQLNALGTVVSSGAVSFSLVGTAPSVVVAQLSAAGSLLPLPVTGGTIQFPDTVINTASTITLSIANTGSGPATITSISTTGNDYQFQNLPLLPQTINAGAQLTATLRFVPVATGPRAGSVQISFGSGSFSASLTGNGIVSLVTYQLSQNGTTSPLVPGQNITFSDTTPGTPVTATILLQNAGSIPIAVSQALITGAGFSLVNPPFFPLSLAPQQTTALTVSYNPTAPGPSLGRLAIGSDTFSLSGNGLGSTFQFSYAVGGSTSTVVPGGTISFPPVPVGQPESLQFNLANSGTAPGSLFNISIAGGGGAFQLQNLPALPSQVNAGVSNSFTITYTPTTVAQTTATLQVNNQSFTLIGNATGVSLQYSTQSNTGVVSPVPASGSITFPVTANGQTSSLQFNLTNAGTTTGSVSAISLIGGGTAFQLGPLPALPLQIGPNGTAGFSILFTPQPLVQSTATLQVDNQTFTLIGPASTAPPLPSYHFTGATASTQPFQQPSIGLSLNSPYPVAISGTLTLTVSSSVNFVTDPAVQFSSGGRTVAFTIPANTLQAIFPNNSTQIQIQSGTLASVIQIVPSFNAGLTNGVNITPSSPVNLQLTVPTTPPAIIGAVVSARTLTSFSITLSAYVSTRYLDHVTVQLTPASGSTLAATSFTIDVSGASRIWFQSTASQTLGGQFLLDIPFALVDPKAATGTDLTKSVASVSLTAVNDVGSSSTVKVVLP